MQPAKVYNKVASAPMTEAQSYVYFEESSPIPHPDEGPICYNEKGSVDAGALFKKVIDSLLNLRHFSFNALMSASLELPLTGFSNVFCSRHKISILTCDSPSGIWGQ